MTLTCDPGVALTYAAVDAATWSNGYWRPPPAPRPSDVDAAVTATRLALATLVAGLTASYVTADSSQGAAEVAARLEAAAVRGLRGSRDQCPVARYLYAVTGAAVSVDRYGVLVTGQTWVALPAPVGRFVYLFDRGAFPALDVDVWGASP